MVNKTLFKKLQYASPFEGMNLRRMECKSEANLLLGHVCSGKCSTSIRIVQNANSPQCSKLQHTRPECWGCAVQTSLMGTSLPLLSLLLSA